MAGKVLFLERMGSALVPTNEAYEHELRSLPSGCDIEVRVTLKRLTPHHKKIWQEFTDIARIFQAHGKPEYDQDAVKRLALILSGDCFVWPLPKALQERHGTPVGVAPGSLSYSAKDEIQVRRFHDQWRKGFYEEIYPYFDDFTRRRCDLIFASNRDVGYVFDR